MSNKCSIIAAGVKSVASAIIYDTFGIFPCGFPGTRDKLAPARSNAYPASKIHARTETTGISSGWLVDNSTSTSTLRLKHPRSRVLYSTPRPCLFFFPPLSPSSCFLPSFLPLASTRGGRGLKEEAQVARNRKQKTIGEEWNKVGD